MEGRLRIYICLWRLCRGRSRTILWLREQRCSAVERSNAVGRCNVVGRCNAVGRCSSRIKIMEVQGSRVVKTKLSQELCLGTPTDFLIAVGCMKSEMHMHACVPRHFFLELQDREYTGAFVVHKTGNKRAHSSPTRSGMYARRCCICSRVSFPPSTVTPYVLYFFRAL